MARDFFTFHAAFALVCLGGMVTPLPVGWQFALLVLLYNLTLPLFAYLRGHEQWLRLWAFLLPLSIFQVFPDWMLSSYVKVLVFPEDGFFKIGSVSAYMAGLWVIPLFIIVQGGLLAKGKWGESAVWIAVGLLSLLIFGGSEETLWQLGSWYARDVNMLGHTALYVLPAELILGWTTFAGFQLVGEKAWWQQLLLAFLIMLVYTGALMFFYFFLG